MIRESVHLPRARVRPPFDFVPDALAGVRTMFNAFHHFRPDDARAVLGDAFRARQPVAIFDGADRSALGMLAMLWGPAAIVALAPFLGPPRLKRLAVTWGLPILPGMVLWDGVVSSLRAYRPEEMRALTEGFAADDYTWEVGRAPFPYLPLVVNYVVGIPTPTGR